MRIFPRNVTLLVGSVKRSLWLLVGVALVPILIIQAGVYVVWFQTRLEEARRANLEFARAVAGTFREFIEDVRRHELTIGTALTSWQPYTPDVAKLRERQPDRRVEFVIAEGAPGKGATFYFTL